MTENLHHSWWGGIQTGLSSIPDFSNLEKFVAARALRFHMLQSISEAFLTTPDDGEQPWHWYRHILFENILHFCEDSTTMQSMIEQELQRQQNVTQPSIDETVYQKNQTVYFSATP